ncbi:hypothetical protein AGMMS49545_23600 [Betaproteobacteria bacterium]|nr:hypothetical protein AGMMS49545_23600 [Betaproteobacteria bacterium]GHU41284.1 hypothetical protein AGMMS50289_04180 [Betaproteobacteria bacterium]
MFLLALAFAFLKDMGQIFTGLLAIGFFGLGMFFISRGDRNIRASIFAGIVVVALMLYQLPSVGPVLSALGHTHIEERIELIAPDHEFKGGKEYLSLLRWFMRDAPALGFGLGHVPWCGTVQLSDTKCDGLEAQSQSDYVFAVLAGVFGQFFAWLILGATALFLLLLVRRTSLRPDHPYYFSQLYGNYVVRAFFIVSIFQLFVTSLGSVGALPLTGITFPLLSYGGASLMGVSFFTALVINRMPEKIKRG